jgi:hypothetical protein
MTALVNEARTPGAKMAVFIIGNYQHSYRESFEFAIRNAAGAGGNDTEAYFTPDPGVGKELLINHELGAVKCILADVDREGVDRFLTWVRGQVTLFSVPVFGLLPRITDHSFREAHAAGFDDALCYTDMDGLSKRVAVLANYDASLRPPITQGVAVVAHPDQGARRVFGRILRQAGFDLQFAGAPDELAEISGVNSPRIVVVSTRLAGQETTSCINQIRQTTGIAELPCVVVSDGDERNRDIAAELMKLNATELMAEKTPPDTLLFVTNELLRRQMLQGKPDEQRASTRLQYDGLCAFRSAGELVPTYGYSYNISFEGIYIKTYAPPPRAGDVWLDLRLNEEDSAAHLRGNLVWTRRPDSSKPALAPPGFGFRIDPGSCPPHDLERYQAMYQRLLSEKEL